jgi:hypothetical protein
MATAVPPSDKKYELGRTAFVCGVVDVANIPNGLSATELKQYLLENGQNTVSQSRGRC